MEILKPGIAVVGIGRWGRNLLREFSALADVRAQVTRHSPVTLTDALADPHVEAVVIATPIASHAAVARAALEAGKHVFLEKPGTSSEAELTALTRAAEERRLILQIGYVFLHHPAFAVLEQIHRNDPITELHADWRKTGTFGEPIGLNLLCHDIAIACHLFGEPDRAERIARTSVISGCDIVAARLTWTGGTAAHLAVNRASPEKRKTVSVRTTSGRWLAWNDNDLLELDRAGGVFTPVPTGTGTALEAECRSFLARCAQRDAVRDGLPLQVHRTLALLDL